MRNLISNKKQKTKLSKMNSKVETPSTLLIPKEWEKFLLKQISIHGNLNKYLHYLLDEYQIFIQSEIISKSKLLKTTYQKNGQNLIQKNFRPLKEDWFKLKLLRDAFGYSISYFFVFLMKLDRAEVYKIGRLFIQNVVPTTFEKVSLYGGFEFNKKESSFYRVFAFQ